MSTDAKMPPPVFVVGAARSGTTMVQQMLARHPAFSLPWESHFIPALWARRERYGSLADTASRERLILDIANITDLMRGQLGREWVPGLRAAASELAREAAPSFAGVVDAVFRFHARQQGRIRWGDKTPGYIDHLDTLRTIFPDARFVIVVRDPRDVAASVMPLSFGPNTAFMAGRRWLNAVRHGLDFAARHPEQTLLLRYEDIIDQPEKHARHLCDFLSEDYSPDMLETRVAAASSVPLSDIHAQVRRPVNRSAEGRWRRDLSARQVRIIEAVCGPLMKQLGYEQSIPGARLSRWDKRFGRLGHHLLWWRPFTKPVGLCERLAIAWRSHRLLNG
ncbi:MAG: sulfotransferase [Candidatus Sumerlaeaceae bacterium]|nr:sulfotransferase [Candidatus Sumerlaeaceae bacterium]